MKPTWTAVLLALAFTGAALVASNCGGINCSPCPRGMHVSDSARKCSACMPDDDGGSSDAGAGSDADASVDPPADASTDTSPDISAADALLDVSVDTGPDISVDASPDISVDASPDVSVDTSGPETPQNCSGPFPDVGCFTGAPCTSTRVDAVCAAGLWKCPVGSNTVEHCPPVPDAGADASDAGADASGADAPVVDDAAAEANDDAPAVSPDAPDAGVDASTD